MLLNPLVKVKTCKYASRYVANASLQLVEEVVEWWDALLQTLTFPGIVDNSSRLGRRLKRVTRQDLPVVKDTLWECLATSVGAQVSSETYDHNHKLIITAITSYTQ